MPAPSVPADDAALLSRMGSRPLVRHLVDHPDSYYGDIREATGAPVSTLTRELRILEDIGVVVTDVEQPQGARRGRAPRYRVDVNRVDALLNDLRQQLLG